MNLLPSFGLSRTSTIIDSQSSQTTPTAFVRVALTYIFFPSTLSIHTSNRKTFVSVGYKPLIYAPFLHVHTHTPGILRKGRFMLTFKYAVGAGAFM